MPSALPKTFRPVLWTLGAIASVGVAYAAIGSWMDSRAEAKVSPVRTSVERMADDLKATRAAAEEAARDAAYLRGRLDQ